MSVPKSVTRYKRGNKASEGYVEVTSNVDFYKYTIQELTRAAMRDVGKFIVIATNRRAWNYIYSLRKKATPGRAQRLENLARSKRLRGKKEKGKDPGPTFQYWVRPKETDLRLYIKQNTWYGMDQELGTNHQPKKGLLRNTVLDNVVNIVKIESQYLTAIKPSEVLHSLGSLVDEKEYIGSTDDE